MAKSKYHSRKITVDGIEFDSKKEAKRYSELLLLERAGAIQNLQRQVKFVLIPAQYLTVGMTKKGKAIKKCVERECAYIADFTYTDDCGVEHVEDTKGFRTKDYIIKRKLMLFIHRIQIEEV